MPTPFGFLIPALWIVWLAYWFVAPRGDKPVEKSETGVSQLTYGVPLWIAVWLMVGPGVPTAFLDMRLWPQASAILVAGTALVAAGLGFAVWARRHLGANWPSVASVKQGHELIRSGPYRLVRHPIYTGILLAALGSGLAVGEWRAVVALAIGFLGLYRKALIEERWMVETFGIAYENYRGETAALVPFVF